MLIQAKNLKKQLDESKIERFLSGKSWPRPNRPQREFIESKARITALVAANKIGKSSIAAILTIRDALKGGKICRVIGSLGFERGIRDTIVPEIKKWIPHTRLLKEKMNSQGVTTQMIISGDNGKDSIISFLSGNQDEKDFEGDLVDSCWIDEPCRRSIYYATLRALLMSNGPLRLTMTPLSEPWIYNEIECSNDPEVKVIHGILEDALIENGGHMTREQFDSFVSKLPEDEYEARVMGRYRHLLGRVYKRFNLNEHVVQPFKIPRSWPVWCSIDPHQRKPHAALWLACSPEEEWFLCDELYMKAGIEEFGNHVANKSQNYNMIRTVIDTSSETMDWNRRETARSILERECHLKLSLARKRNNKEPGRLLIQQALEGRDGTNKPWLKVFSTCERTIFEFQNYVWDDNKNPDKAGILEEPRKVNDEMMDNLNYIVVEKPRYSRPRIIDNIISIR